MLLLPSGSTFCHNCFKTHLQSPHCANLKVSALATLSATELILNSCYWFPKLLMVLVLAGYQTCFYPMNSPEPPGLQGVGVD